MNKEEKKRLIKKYKDLGGSYEGLSSCIHGIKLYKNCTSCGREIIENEKDT